LNRVSQSSSKKVKQRKASPLIPKGIVPFNPRALLPYRFQPQLYNLFIYAWDRKRIVQMTDKPKHERLLQVRAPWLTGSLLAVISLPIHLAVSHHESVVTAAVILGLIAGIYIGFALVDGRVRWLIIESTIAILFVSAATFGVMEWQWAIPIAYAMHGLWDWAHHRLVGTMLPRWYVPLCAIYDWIAAAGLALIWMYYV
jgi:hypothetical protein